MPLCEGRCPSRWHLKESCSENVLSNDMCIDNLVLLGYIFLQKGNSLHIYWNRHETLFYRAQPSAYFFCFGESVNL